MCCLTNPSRIFEKFSWLDLDIYEVDHHSHLIVDRDAVSY
jgi:hypothetical protein